MKFRKWIDLKKYSSGSPYYRTIRSDGYFFPYISARFYVSKLRRVYTYKPTRMPDGSLLAVRREKHQFGIRLNRFRITRYRTRRRAYFHPRKYDTTSDARYYGEMKQKWFT